ncbi:CoA transferase, partial [Burkholderia gladioli]|nr:CoA transferase [Burkholderia gladioli]
AALAARVEADAPITPANDAAALASRLTQHDHEGAGDSSSAAGNPGDICPFAIAVLSALALRARTGKGSGVSVSLFDGAADWMTVPYVHERYGRGAPSPQGLKHPSIAPYGAYVTSDGRQIVISIQNEREWHRFCTVFLGDEALADEPRFASNNARVSYRAELDARIGEAFAGRSLNEALQLLSKANIAYGQLRNIAELIEHPALRTWPMQTDGAELQMIAPAVRAPWDAQRFARAPRLGEHTDRLRAEFASTSDELPV